MASPILIIIDQIVIAHIRIHTDSPPSQNGYADV